MYVEHITIVLFSSSKLMSGKVTSILSSNIVSMQMECRNVVYHLENGHEITKAILRSDRSENGKTHSFNLNVFKLHISESKYIILMQNPRTVDWRH
jgi:hypothetical protein